MEHLNDDNFLVFYASLEMSSEMVFGKLLSLYIFEKYGVRLSINHIFSRKKNYTLSDDEYKLVMEGLEWIKTIEKKIIIYDKALNADSLYAILMNLLEKQGNFEESEHRKIYTPNNPKLVFNIVIDHISLLQPNKGRDLKREIDLATSYLITLRNMCKISPIIVQQINRDAASMDRRKQGLSDMYALLDFKKQNCIIPSMLYKIQ